MGWSHTLTAVGALAATVRAVPVVPRSSFLEKRQENNTKVWATFENGDIIASADLKWTDCYEENNKCALLTVPLDYADPSVGTIDIAYRKLVVSEDAEDLLFNPGGPGAPAVATPGSDMGKGWAKKWGYNLVSFDPRGVGLSGPVAECSYDPIDNSTQSAIQRRDNNFIREQYDVRMKQNLACNEANKDTPVNYIGTLANVQDMMHFTELQAAAKGQKPEEAKINYYGVSYGTLLGQTLAATYPDRLRRVLLDSNMYGVGYYQGWHSTAYDDFTHGVWMFAKLCYEAGPEWCALAEGMGSIEEVLNRFGKAMASLDSDPWTVEGVGPVPSWSVWKMVHTNMYSPASTYQTLVNYTLGVETRDITLFGASPDQTVEAPGPAPAPPRTDRVLLITAVDSAINYPWKTYEDWRAAAERLMAVTPRYPTAVAVWALSNGLAGFGMENVIPPPSQRFPGFDVINTSVPILFVNNAGDPVTPMSATHVMSRLFTGSSWVIQNSPGHSFNSVNSNCTQEIVAAYFADATVPEPGTWCEPDVKASFYFGDKTAVL